MNNDLKEKLLKKLLNLLILLTGREPELTIQAIKNDEVKKDLINQLLDNLISTDSGGGLALINTILLILGIPPMGQRFYESVFGSNTFKNIEEIEKCVNKIRCVYMLEYGNFHDGYRILRNRDPQEIVRKHFSSEEEAKQIRNKYESITRKIPGLYPIDISQRYVLGYLSPEAQKSVEEHREIVKSILEEARENLKDLTPQKLTQFANTKIQEIQNNRSLKVKYWVDLLMEANLWHTNDLLYFGTLFNTSQYPYYIGVIDGAIEECKKVVNIDQIREWGRRNTFAYIGSDELDVYFATSMRVPQDYLSNGRFVDEVIKKLEKIGLKILYFDPTLSYLDDRIHKGLVESIMIRKAKIIVYNAQEHETFGKDAEAGIGLAHRKHVIIYVPRILSDDDNLVEFYRILDEFGHKRAELGEQLFKHRFLTKVQKSKFNRPETTIIDAINKILRESRKLKGNVEKIHRDEIEAEFINKGIQYPQDDKELINFCLEKILSMEARALLFRDLHPLTFQISPLDGLARGVFVARKETDVAELIKNLLLKRMEYEILDEGSNYILRDKITRSPIRAIPKDKSLRVALSQISKHSELKG